MKRLFKLAVAALALVSIVDALTMTYLFGVEYGVSSRAPLDLNVV